MRSILFACAALLSLVLMSWGFDGLEAANAPETDMIVFVPKDAELRKLRVSFPHARHKKIDGTFFECTFCHHKWDQSRDPRKCASAGCHDQVSPNGGATGQGYRYFRNAFHGKADFSCNGCHGLRAQAGKTHGPTACGDCHRQEAP